MFCGTKSVGTQKPTVKWPHYVKSQVFCSNIKGTIFSIHIYMSEWPYSVKSQYFFNIKGYIVNIPIYIYFFVTRLFHFQEKLFTVALPTLGVVFLCVVLFIYLNSINWNFQKLYFRLKWPIMSGTQRCCWAPHE